jgi:uncharacterized protein (DUF2141 family)
VKAALAMCLAVFLGTAGHARAGRLVITIDGLRSASGHVFVAIFTRPDGFPDGDYSYRHVKVRAAAHPLTVVFDDLPPGRYAAGCYHDENNNRRLDTNFFGYPLEGYALSNDIRAVFSRPRFEAAAFWVNGSDGHVTHHVRY